MGRRLAGLSIVVALSLAVALSPATALGAGAPKNGAAKGLAALVKKLNDGGKAEYNTFKTCRSKAKTEAARSKCLEDFVGHAVNGTAKAVAGYLNGLRNSGDSCPKGQKGCPAPGVS
jgi:hypothetical protein